MNRREIILGASAFCLSPAFSAKAASDAVRPIYVPAEEAPHQCTFMQWPVHRGVHSDRQFLDLLQNTIADIANTISEFEPVIMLAEKQHHHRARSRLSAAIDLWDIPTDDLWCRDSGPLFAFDETGQMVVSHIQFNGWGAKQIATYDAHIARAVAERLDLPIVPSGLIGEAGGVEHDGHGLLLAHESSWVNRDRNPDLSRDDIERRLLAAYGAERMIWAPGIWGQDITDYHIDSIARFTGPGRILINMPETPDPDDPFHLAASQTLSVIKEADLDIEIIPEPRFRRVNAIDFVASYANFYICNAGILAAQFGDVEKDEIARDALKRHYPDREIVSLNVDVLGEIGGGIHCATQQMPAHPR